VLLACFLLLVPGRAAALEVTATLDRQTAQVGEQVLLSVTVEGGLRSTPTPELPELGDAFEVYSGQRTSRNVSILNGKVSSTVTTEFVLVPRQVGTFTLGPIVVETKDETARTSPLHLTVTAATAPPSPSAKNPEERGSVEGSDELFVRATVDNGRPFVNQQVIYRVRLYSRVNFLENPQFSHPTTEGFWREDLPPRQPYVEVVNGKRYSVMEAAFALFPTTPGPLTVGEATLDCNVQDTRRRRDPLSFFGGSLFDGKRVVLRSEPVQLDVRPLPPGAPPGFQGVVGEFQLRATVDKTRVPQNEPVTLTLEVSGEGNLRSVGEIPKPVLTDFRTYPSGSERKPYRNADRVGGALTEQIVLVPLSAGEKKIPPAEMVIFSPRREEYATLRTSPLTIMVEPGTGAPLMTGGGRGDIEVVGRDIRFLETEVPDFVAVGASFPRARLWIFLLPLPLLGYVGLWVRERQHRRLGADVALRRRRGAGRAARDLLRNSRGKDVQSQVAGAGEALRVYLADRYNLPRAGLTADLVAPFLVEEGMEPEAVLRYLEYGDAARFAPGALASGSGDPIGEVERVISNLEKRG
jgi:hypothetical protein